ncbi:MAG: IgGFc-binding protein [Myxococcales bacterium]|nr:IgGFc-binding protein [Myxococcales bacterium]
MRAFVLLFTAAVAVATLACGPSASGDDDDTGCQNRCTSFGWEHCLSDGVYEVPIRCEANEVCLEDVGCAVCTPDQVYCGAIDQVWMCNGDGTSGTLVTQCPAGEVCGAGVCTTPCQRALGEPSNVGCDFWAADLDNEAAETLFLVNDAAAQQYSIVVANNNDYDVQITVFKNAGRVGGLDEQVVLQTVALARSAKQVDLPAREVDGTMGQNGTYARYSGSGTFVSPHAYHMVTTGPVVAYQFNPIVQQFSNDASILIPIQALGRHYYVWGWPTANPCGPAPGTVPGIDASIPDHTSITIIGVEDNTQVTVNATHPIKASAGDTGFSIAATPAGQPLTFTIDRYDVVNLESDQPTVPIQECFNFLDRDGDFMGSLVTSDKKVAVFTGLERGIGTGGAMPPDPPNWDGESCCTDHLEEQLLPTTALGREFAVSRSPVRSTNPSYREPDMYRVLASEDGVQITTSLPGPFASFSLNAGEYKAFYADRGFTLSATGAVTLGQVLVSQHRVPDGFTGDPSLVIFPSAEQHRKDYVFLVPSTFRQNYFVLAKPVSGTFTVDGRALGEFAGCQVEPIGVVLGINYEQVTCPVTEGQHTVAGSDPFGVTVYGYYNVGSYAFAGGSDLKIINPIGKPKAPTRGLRRRLPTR